MLHLLKPGEMFTSAGGGASGGKFLNMKNGAEQSVAAGFLFKPTLEVQTDFFLRHLKESGMRSAFENREPFGKIMELSQKAKWNGPEMMLFEQAHLDFAQLGEPALMIRSNTTQNDKMGNGTYSSKSIISFPGNIAEAAKEVALSFFTDKARVVRELAGIIGDEFALMLQPIVWDRSGQTGHFEMGEQNYEMKYDTQIYAPRLSGYLRTRTPYGVPKLGLAKGLAFNIMASPTEGLSIDYGFRDKTLTDMNDFHHYDGLRDYETGIMKKTLGLHGYLRFSGTRGEEYGTSIFRGQTLVMYDDGSLAYTDAGFSQGWRDTYDWTASRLFEIVLALKEMRKCEQSVEFAMVRDDSGNPLYYQTQRTDYEVPFFKVSSGIGKELLIGKGGFVMGAGERKIRHVARISTVDGWQDLGYATGKYPGIALSLSDWAFERKDRTRRKFEYDFEAFGKASVIAMDTADKMVLEFFEAHVGGMLGLMDKVLVAFGKMDWKKLEKNARLLETTRNGIEIYETDATLQASEKGQKAVLYLNREAQA